MCWRAQHRELFLTEISGLGAAVQDSCLRETPGVERARSAEDVVDVVDDDGGVPGWLAESDASELCWRRAAS